MKTTKMFITGMAMSLLVAFTTVQVQAQCSSSAKKSHYKNASWSGWTNGNHGSNKTVVDLAVGTEDLSTLVAAVKAAGLVETLQGDGPFTIFAPTNEAFAALPKGTVEKLLKPENKAELVKILTYHVVSGNVTSSKLYDNQQAGTVQGSNVKIRIYENAIKVNDATVIKANIQGKNGVVHLIDRVILPPSNN
ncbi:MAG: fasciclin domain-containing protein [Flammeovirgaceae bacterium]